MHLAAATFVACLVSISISTSAAASQAPGPEEEAGGVPESLSTAFRPPDEFRGDFGPYDSPLVFEYGRTVRDAAGWRERRRGILAAWHEIMGEWPPLIDRPAFEVLEAGRRGGFEQRRVRVEVAPERTMDGYLLVPDGDGPKPAVLVVYYEPETAIGEGKELRDFALQLARRGFVTLSLGISPDQITPGRGYPEIQPLSYLAYAAANAYTAMAQLPEVDPERVGVMGHSYGGKWALFAACLDERFDCGVWSDPGIVFDESRPNVNYWEPWYLGWEPGRTRGRGVITEERPRTGAYKELVERGHDLHELLALMAPRPFLVSGGAEDPPERWRALNHAVAVNALLGSRYRVAMTNRPDHSPNEESNEQIYEFLGYVLRPGGQSTSPPGAGTRDQDQDDDGDQAARPHPEQNPGSPPMLAGDWVPDDPHSIDFAALPRVPGEHVVVSDVRGADGVNQHNYLAHHGGIFWVMWSDGPGVEDRVGQRVRFATSPDGLSWSEPKDLTPDPPGSGPGSPHYGTRSKDGLRWIARGFWRRDGELYALASLDEAAGFFGPSLALHAFRLSPADERWEHAGVIADDTINNFPPDRLSTGEWMMSRRPHNYREVGVHFLVGGSEQIDEWQSFPVLGSSGELSAEEPMWWTLPDGNLMALFRDNRRGGYLYRSFSTDLGRTWSTPARTNFPDATSKLHGIRLADGRYVLVSNANPKRRDPLTIAVSDDGVVFSKLGSLVGGRHVDYPHVLEHDGHLFVAFAGGKQSVEVLKIRLDELDRLSN